MTKRFIWVTFQKAGFHKFPEAATHQDLQDVSYLGYVHRHLFKFKVKIEVTHNNREIEFHQFLKFCEGLFENNFSVDFKSVEMIADDLSIEIEKKYGKRKLFIEVSEDGECGCEVEYN